jgi:predicted metal-binding membrane protein
MNEMTTMSASQQVPMMVAMMLPAAVPALVRLVRAGGGAGGALRFSASYAVVWALAGLVVFELWAPHGVVVAGLFTLGGAAYELTPLKRACRGRCQELVGSGFVFGLYCLGSSLGLMVMLAALGVMSVAWMAVVGVLVLAQKVVPPAARLDLSLALAIAVLGVAVAVAPSSIPALATT